MAENNGEIGFDLLSAYALLDSGGLFFFSCLSGGFSFFQELIPSALKGLKGDVRVVCLPFLDSLRDRN